MKKYLVTFWNMEEEEYQCEVTAENKWEALSDAGSLLFSEKGWLSDDLINVKCTDAEGNDSE